jgi:hypothetical protein
MRSPMIVAVPLLAALAAAPASAQVSARMHVQIPLGRPGEVRRGADRRLVVHQYDARRYGAWESYYDQWLPETVYYYDGDYYDYPIVAYAEPIVVYRYRDDLFLAPREREFTVWRQEDRAAPARRDVGRDYRPAPRETRSYPIGRGPRDVRPQQAPRYDQRSAPAQPGRVGQDRGGQDRGGAQAPRDSRGGHAAPAPRGGQAAPAPRGGGHSRSRP